VSLPVEPWTYDFCPGGCVDVSTVGGIPGNVLAPLARVGLLTNRVVYRNFGATWSMTHPQTHAPGATDDPPAEHWMGSIARDQSGNVVLGHSVARSTLLPGIGLAGRPGLYRLIGPGCSILSPGFGARGPDDVTRPR